MKAIKVRVNSNRQFYRGTRRDTSYHLPYYERHKSTFFNNYPANQRTLIRIWQELHHHTGHSNAVMRKRWLTANKRFEAHHMPYAWGRSTCRFVNEYTAHRWM